MIGKWLKQFWEKKKAQFQNRKRGDLHRRFATDIQKKYEWKQNTPYLYVDLIHRRTQVSLEITRQQNLKQMEVIIKKYMPKTVMSPGTVILRQERSRLLSVLEDIGHQSGEQKQLEQFIFRRKEQEWRKRVHMQEEALTILKEELVRQRKTVEILEKRMKEPAFDKNQLFAEFRRQLEEQLWLERQRSGW